MTAKEAFGNLSDKYGEDFNWGMLSPTDTYFVEELKKEIGADNILFEYNVKAVARSYSSDEALYLLKGINDKDVYRIYHLTYSSRNMKGFPKYEEFFDIDNVSEYIEKKYVEEYL